MLLARDSEPLARNIVHQWQVQGRHDEIERPTEDIPSNLVTVPGCRHHRHHHYHRLLENLLAEGKSRSRGIIETVFNENNLDSSNSVGGDGGGGGGGGGGGDSSSSSSSSHGGHVELSSDLAV
ncbi:hypothetical protein HZH68_001465 [Vespula germanica]|uniref:Uncharacterized protein n=1 Tax=Vespula germanica TaxID=30212 RepID=A0A834NVP7_VESGE|nr:hypothetical protein HZH68_001465 [Vespula germanica]